MFGGKKGFALKKDAEKADAELRERMEVSNTNKMPRTILTLEQGFELYVDEMKTQLKQSTLQTNSDSIKVFADLLPCKITSITPLMIKNELKEMDKKGIPLTI